MRLANKIKNFIERDHLLKTGDRVIVAVSGGPDSVTLLHILNSLRHDLGLKLFVGHVNHNLRNDSHQDAAFVQDLADKLNLPYYSASIRLRKKKEKTSIEELGREGRLRFFVQLAKKLKADCIALGHTQDDLAETVLMRILRGTGLLGLRGILPKRELEGRVFIRPLLKTRRKEIESFLKNHCLKFCTDTSNVNPKFFRNKIRRQLLPILEKTYNPNIKEILAHLADSISADYDYLEKKARIAGRKLTERKPEEALTLRLKLRSFQKLDISLQRILIRQSIEKLKGNTRQFSFVHIQEIENLLLHKTAGAIVHLPAGIHAVKTKKHLLLTRRNA